MVLTVGKTESQLTSSHNADSICLLGPTRIRTEREEFKEDETDESGDGVVTETKEQNLVIGTYALDERKDTPSAGEKRIGGFHIISATRTTKTFYGSQPDQAAFSLTTQSTHDNAAVLDVNTIPPATSPSSLSSEQENCSFYAACADDSIIRGASSVLSKNFSSISCSEISSTTSRPNILNLSVHSTRDEDDDNLLIASSDSKGHITMYKAYETEGNIEHEKLDCRPMHLCEAWTTFIMKCAISSSNLILSGGDDGILTCFTLNDPNPCWRIRDAHSGVGVTCISSPSTSMHSDFKVWTGGYDDHVRVWDIRHMKHDLYDVNVGGGVWRIRFHPNNPNLVLIAAMYDGFKVIQFADQLENPLKLVAEYGKGENEHSSIAYGAEWVPGLEDDDSGSDNQRQYMAVTASFYDKAVRLWSFTSEDVT